jgi:hypothetical protein
MAPVEDLVPVPRVNEVVSPPPKTEVSRYRSLTGWENNTLILWYKSYVLDSKI